MSSMLEQAIVDAQALREAALKNAEQSVVEKYAPEIKAAVESLLEGDAKQKVIKEEFEIPYAADPVDKEQEVKMVVEYEFNPEDFKLDLDSLQNAPEQSAEEPAMDMSMETPALPEEAAPVEPTADLEGLLAESDLADDNDLVNEILAILGESDEEEEEAYSNDLTRNTLTDQLTGIDRAITPILIDAMLEVVGANDLLEYLNTFPGAQIIAKILSESDCVEPPFGIDFPSFMKEGDIEFCRAN